MNKCQRTTMCIVHKGFRGFRVASPASILGGNLTGLKPAIPYDTIHSTLYTIRQEAAVFKIEREIGEYKRTLDFKLINRL